MTRFLLSLHVLAAILAVGPVSVAASMFPAALRRAHGETGGGDALATLRTLHRVCRVYAGVGVAVPVFGFATAGSLGVLGSAWLIAAMLLTAVAAGVLALLILPAQDHALAEARATGSTAPTGFTAPTGDSAPAGTTGEPAASEASTASTARKLAMLTGLFNLLWATVTVLMIIRPGSTTGV